jgi:plastocyanin
MRGAFSAARSPQAAVVSAEKEKQMKGKIRTLADRTPIRTMIASVFVAGLVTVGNPAQAGLLRASAQATPKAARVTTIKVTAHNSIFVFSSKTAKRGVVIFKVTNTASFRHDFSIKGRTTRVLSQGESAILRVTFRRKGRYTYKCTVDHHASWGQKGVFTIT